LETVEIQLLFNKRLFREVVAKRCDSIYVTGRNAGVVKVKTSACREEMRSDLHEGALVLHWTPSFFG
jgi:hypothetical protein